MYTVYRKGQGTIGEVFIFYTIIFVNIILMILLISGGGVFTKEVNPEINYELGNVRAQSTVTATTNDYLWRSDNTDPGKYNFKQANKLISMYFSTPGSTIYFGEREIPKSELKSDLEEYMKYKMEKYWMRGPGDTRYQFQIRYDDGEELSVRSNSFQPKASDSKISVPIALTEGEYAAATVWYRPASSGVYDTTGSGGNLVVEDP